MLSAKNWWFRHIIAYLLVVLIFVIFNPSVVVMIYILYILSTAYDVPKMINYMKWPNVDFLFSHVNYWHIKTISIWALPLLFFGIFVSDLYFYGLIIFWTEDFLYYVVKYFSYGKFLPDELPWLIEFEIIFNKPIKIPYTTIQIKRLAIPWLTDWLKTKKLTRRAFLITVLIQQIIFIFLMC